MEDFDEEIQQPDRHGVLDMSHRAWATLDDTIWSWGSSLLILNIAFNEIREVPSGIGALVVMREFNAGSNIIESLPPEIGRCRALKKLKLNGNRLRSLPKELSQCRGLEVITASENLLETIPAELSTLPMLSVLSLPNNRLREIPTSMADCHTIVDMDVSNNPDLDMIPVEVRTNARVILWICDRWRLHETQLRELQEANEDLEMLAKTQDDQKMRMKEEIKVLKRERAAWQRERPVKYMALKSSCRTLCCTIM